MTVSFSKYQAAGNDFIVIDDRLCRFPLDDSSYIQKLCSRRFGIGADGLLLLQPSSKADFQMRICNSDGKEASFCGNGLRCLALYIKHLGFQEDSFSVETKSFIARVAFQGGKVLVYIPSPKVLHWSYKPEEEDIGELFVVDSGVPHAVLFVDDPESCPVEELGKKIRHRPFFGPAGVNVNFVKVMPDGSIRIRTYERGVEAETLSCGSGAAAAAFVVGKQTGSQGPFRVVPSSGEHSEFSFEDTSREKTLCVKGPASSVFEGRLFL